MAELEGFLCPYCKKDLKGIAQLEEHFKDEHEEKRFTKFKSNIKTIFDKAKPKIMRKRELFVDEGATAAVASLSFFDPAAIVSGIDPALWPPQEIGNLVHKPRRPELQYVCHVATGAVVSHMHEFRRIRDSKLAREGVESNRLVIRLEKVCVCVCVCVCVVCVHMCVSDVWVCDYVRVYVCFVCTVVCMCMQYLCMIACLQ